MKLLLSVLLVLGIAISLTLFAYRDPGYVQISYSDWSVESSLSLFMLVEIAVFFLFYAALRIFSGAWRLPRRLGFWKRRRRALRAHVRTNRGLIALAEGNWGSAERLLSHAAKASDTPLINYLGAARAAQKQGSEQRRDQYLSEAYQSMPEAELAVGLTQVDVQLSQGQTEQALASLRHLRSIAPNHSYVLYLLKKLYEKLESWDDLYQLLPELRRHHVLNSEELDALELHLHRVRLSTAGDDIGKLLQCWEQMPRALKHQPELILDYANQLKRLGEEKQAEKHLRDYLKKSWDPQLMRMYGQVQGEDLEQQLATAEYWLREHEQHPELLLACARLCLYNKLWGKARSYLEASLGAENRAETCCELGNLLQQMGEKERAAAYFRQGLELVSGGSCTHVVVTRHAETLQPGNQVQPEVSSSNILTKEPASKEDIPEEGAV